MILIFTNKEDAHPTPVIQILNGRNVPVFRLNTEALLTDSEFCWENDAHGCDFAITCIRNGLTLRGSEVTAVWDRRPEPPEKLPVHITASIDKHNRTEALGFLYFLRYYLKDIPSIGSIVYDRVASSKMLQAKIAQAVGFTVPDTCYSNRKADIARLADKHEELVLKPVESDGIWNDGDNEEYVFYTQKIHSATLRGAPDEAFTQTVSFVQEYVPKAYELRVTVVGDKVFTCKIDSQRQDDDTGKVDWRQGYGHGLKYEAYNLPDDIAGKCIRYLKLMRLKFGAFDFVVTPTGEYVFLECNPNGQWLWIELATEIKISEAIADFLQEPKTKDQYENIE